MLPLGKVGEDFLLHRGKSRRSIQETLVPGFKSFQRFVDGNRRSVVRTHADNGYGRVSKPQRKSKPQRG
jgi:hypothetical protein